LPDACYSFSDHGATALAALQGHDLEFVFRTYADLLGFVAAYGFQLTNVEGRRLPAKPDFLDVPNSIGLEIFENRGLYTNFLTMALAYDESRQIAEDEEQLAKLVEKYASLGAENLSVRISGKSRPAQLLEIGKLLEVDKEDHKI